MDYIFICDECYVNTTGDPLHHQIGLILRNNLDSYITDYNNQLGSFIPIICCIQCEVEIMRNFIYLGTHAKYPNIRFYGIN